MSIAYRLPNQSDVLGVRITKFSVSDMPDWLTKVEITWDDVPLMLHGDVVIALALRDEARKSYEGYLRTEHWHKVREWRKAIARYRCEVDNRHTGELHVHHLRYTHLGCEPPEDLAVLCDNCHKTEHGLMSAQIRESLQ